MQTFSVEHLLQLEQFGFYFGGPFSFSPAGTALAFVVQRSRLKARQHQYPFLWGNDRADVWLIQLPDGKPMQITHGEAEGVGYWAPTWSSDGQRLAMLSNQEDGITLWVWEKATNKLRQLTSGSLASEDESQLLFCWLNSETLVCSLMPDGEKPKFMTIMTASVERSTAAWQKAWQGQESTASVLRSGVGIDLARRPQRRLCKISAIDGSTEVLLTAPIYQWTLSPDRQWIGLLQLADVLRPQPFGVLPQTTHQFALRVVSTQNQTLIQPENSEDVLPNSLRWSPDSDQLAFIAYSSDRRLRPRVCSLDLKERTLNTRSSDRLDPTPALWRLQPQLLWTEDNDLLVYAASASEQPANRWDWWRLGQSDEECCLTETMAIAPPELLAEPGRRSFAGLSAGQLWRIRPDSNRPEPFEFEPALIEFAFPNWAGLGDSQEVAADQGYFILKIAFSCLRLNPQRRCA